MSRASASSAGLALVAASLIGAACAGGGVPDEELSQPPIAVLYWTYEEATDRRRAQEEWQRRPGRLGVADVSDIGALFGAERTDLLEIQRRYPGRLSLVDPATGDVRRIEAAPPGAVPMAWRDDRKALLFAAPGRSRTVQLYEYRLAEDEVHPITTPPEIHSRGDYGPEGRFATVVDSAVTDSRVQLQGGAGGARRVVFAGAPVLDVRWSPRGDMLLLAVIDQTRGGRDGRARMLFSLDPNAALQTWPPGPGSMLKPLGRGRDPVFSPDGDWIVYSARVGDGWRLRRMRSTGGGRLAIGRGALDEIEPAVSPDGSLVAYVAENDGHHRLFVRRLDGTGDRLLIPDGEVARPVW